MEQTKELISNYGRQELKIKFEKKTKLIRFLFDCNV